MRRCSCGQDLDLDDRFCSRCGLAAAAASSSSSWSSPSSPPSLSLSLPSPSAEPQTDPAETVLLNPGGPGSSTTMESRVSSGFSARGAVLGVAVAILLMWALYRWPQPEVEATGDGRPAATDGEASDADSDSDSDADSDAGTGADDRTDEDSADDDLSSSTGGENGADDESGDEIEDKADDDPRPGPVVGEPTGLGVVVGSYDGGGPMEFVALDTGEIHRLSNVRGRPVGRIGNTLIAAQYGEILALDLATPEADPASLIDFANGWIQAVEIDGDLIRTFQDDEDGSRMLTLTLDGEVVEEVDLLTAPFGFGWPLVGGVSDLVQSTAGGVYRRTGDTFERLSTGRIEASGEEIVLVRECDQRMRCASTWHDRRTWEDLDHPAPSLSIYATGIVGGGDRWLIVSDWRTGSTQVVDIESGQPFREMETGFSPGYGPLTPISDDGRWLVDQDGSKAVVVDLETGREWQLDVSLYGDKVVMWTDVAGTAFED